METTLKPRKFALIAGGSYLVIFFSAIFANFFVLESILNDPLNTIQHNQLLVRAGILAFLITVVFDVVVAWGLYGMYRKRTLSGLSTLFRMMHAAIMGVAISALSMSLTSKNNAEVLQQIDNFNTIWLIGLFFFGIHLILLGKIIGKPTIIALFLVIAGSMYMLDTASNFMLSNYDDYGSIFLILVAVPSILGEMSFSIWLLIEGGKNEAHPVN